MLVIKTCKNCGKKFRFYKTTREKFCSRECYFEARRFRTSIDKETRKRLYDLFWDQNLRLKDIAEIFGRSRQTIRNWLAKVGIPIKDKNELSRQRMIAQNRSPRNPSYHRDLTGSNNPMYGERKFGKDNPMFGKRAIWLSEYNKLNNKERNRKYRLTGERHWNWQRGKSFEPYGTEFNDELKKKIRARDGHKCQKCGISQNKTGYKLIVHHMDFNKLDNNPGNLISLCRPCHIILHNSREVRLCRH